VTAESNFAGLFQAEGSGGQRRREVPSSARENAAVSVRRWTASARQEGCKSRVQGRAYIARAASFGANVNNAARNLIMFLPCRLAV
jgi:hypothetical protein